MFGKINASRIIKDHILTLKNYRTGKLHKPDLFLFFFIPLIISILLIYFGILLNSEIVNVLITSFSIFAGLLLNLLLLVFDIAGKSSNSEQNIVEALKEVYINISFCILICISTIVFLLGFFIKTNFGSYLYILSFLVYYPLFVFIFTLFMVLKRIYLLLGQKFEAKS